MLYCNIQQSGSFAKWCMKKACTHKMISNVHKFLLCHGAKCQARAKWQLQQIDMLETHGV
jgi:hypothetical protein